MTLIRPITAGDLDALRSIAGANGLFPPEMVGDLTAPTLSGDEGAPMWLVADQDGEACGLCYAVPEQLADGVWNMLALGVLPDVQRSGHGRAMVHRLETDLREAGARMLIVDTSSGDGFVGARNFYAGNGYEEEARIRDYWAAGDHKVTFRKML